MYHVYNFFFQENLQLMLVKCIALCKINVYIQNKCTQNKCIQSKCIQNKCVYTKQRVLLAIFQNLERKKCTNKIVCI